MTDSFKTLPLSEPLRDNLESLGYQYMTPIQQQSLPHILAGKDVIAQARTGSGKTAAFGLGLIERLDLAVRRCQALVLCPTRELAAQVAAELRRLASPLPNVKVVTLCGGSPLAAQKTSLEHGAHVVVGTPGRISDHLEKRTLDLQSVNTVVLDEADRMLDMGFYDSIAAIIDCTPARRQTLLFSATYPEDIQELSARFQHQALEISVEQDHQRSRIRQLFYCVTRPRHKLETLLKILGKHQPESCLIFCKTRQGCAELAEELQSRRHSTIALHGDLEQKERDLVLVRFGNASARTLVATDVAARGLDIPDLAMVVNYDVPGDAESYLHRIGRTGRAGKTGLAITLLTQAEMPRIKMLEAFLDQQFELSDVQALPAEPALPLKPAMVTLVLNAGRKDKLRPGDILGALTGNKGIGGHQVGKIDISDRSAYVAVSRSHVREALEHLKAGKIKGRSIRVRRL
ncbi:MAG: ATP-dependent RNA helicase DbpA [Wenzhouxiangellaceae bacterium]|nr:ATP-dependent RNA helicase DbpA [Wenzhouxiangellaceae bacterium]